MRVLALNAGSSSLKATIRERVDGDPLLRTQVERLEDAWLPALTGLGETLAPHGPVDAVVHRIVHGGPEHDRTVAIDEQLLGDLEELVPLAPLHLPAALQTVRDLSASNDPEAGLAVEMFVHGAAMAVASAATALERWRSLVFTGGVGEHDTDLRAAICTRLRLDGVDVRIMAADEELVMDAETRALLW